MKKSKLIILAWGMMVSLGVSAAKWISGDTAKPEQAAPILAKDFTLSQVPKTATFKLAVAGWCEVRVNGTKCGDKVLHPVTCQPDERTSEVTFEVTSLLRQGENHLEVLLGNGWQNAFTLSSWSFHLAPWVSEPKCRGRLIADDKEILRTDGTWDCWDSPIVFNALRNGEWYDARIEGTRPNRRKATEVKWPILGRVMPDDAEPCVVTESFEPIKVVKDPEGNDIYDFGANIAGWCEIEVKGEAGAKVTLDYDESLTPSNTLLGYVSIYLTERHHEPRPVQHDEYTLAGRDEVEKWHPRFTYHGFRYVKVTKTGKVEMKAIRSRFVHSGFTQVGKLDSSDAIFNGVNAATIRSYLSNFTGIPTDCPHREKNGWTGDAQIAAETGLWNFDAKRGYVHFLRMMLDAQRPNGAVPCILPCSPKFGFFWGSGPAWDAILFEIPDQLYRFYGDESAAREAYPAMKRYLAFIAEKFGEDGLIEYGLGDWCDFEHKRRCPVKLTDSAYVYHFNRRAAFWAEKFGESDRAANYRAEAERIKAAFNRTFYKGNGVYGPGESTAMAAPLYFEGLCVNGEEEKVAARLVEYVREHHHHAIFGIQGAKWVPRMLFKYGYVDDAWKLYTQLEMPGWAHWLQFGDGTLRERWNDMFSHNHIMFGDVSAAAYEYVAGIVPIEPGFKTVAIRPHFPEGLASFSAEHMTPHGLIKVSWKRINGKPVVECDLPPGITKVP